MKVAEALFIGRNKLKEKNIEEASLQVKMLLANILACRKEELLIKEDDELSEDNQHKFFNAIERISKGYPVQYIINKKEFMGMELYVEEGVLVPRSDTEILVEETMKIIKEQNKKKVLELCTGSGAIAISICKYLENIEFIATDISKKALDVAKINEGKILKNNRIKFIEGDMFQNIGEKFDVIVSNPPYIKTNVINEYNLKYEPRLALDGGKDGLKFYKIIIEEGYKYLNPNGIILLEIGYDQKEEVMNLVKKSGKYKNSYCIKDLGGNDRVIKIV